jgi:hypothetical protein
VIDEAIEPPSVLYRLASTIALGREDNTKDNVSTIARIHLLGSHASAPWAVLFLRCIRVDGLHSRSVLDSVCIGAPGIILDVVFFLFCILSTINNNNSRKDFRHAVSITLHTVSQHNHTSGYHLCKVT